MTGRSAAEQTAFGPMVIAACERYTPAEQRLLDDDLAARFLPVGQRLVVHACRWAPVRRLLLDATERQAAGLWGSMLCRKRYLDDQVRAAFAAGIDQLVVLGAGLDTRAHRLAVPAGVASFEIDLPANVADKRRRVRAVLGERGDEVRLAPLDLASDDLVPGLERLGYATDRPAVVVWEAVTQYLTEDAVHRTLDALSALATGSRLLFTHIRRDFLDGTHLYGAGPVHRRMTGEHRVWHFGVDPGEVGPLLGRHGWTEVEQVGPAEYRAHHPEVALRGLSISEIERCVRAEKR
ncbi:class I SAM-dependent methyltransferase [Pseudonocardia humida]|uniref:S-adenosyl-L-methionine-dependent methyltransferase n=1 Tax=Pseudonocardia humida TaxID=2800819 RepID=A0ABT1ADU2_9PSEU|nr:SAM-dependent methyltransferase [Pseudonocardia humida]MCO1661178.1 SAM-dependent methyltransferase [Pseudonocardia humida]